MSRFDRVAMTALVFLLLVLVFVITLSRRAVKPLRWGPRYKITKERLVTT